MIQDMQSFAGRIIRESIHLVYPRSCPVCRKLLQNRKQLICPECRQRLNPIKEPRCKLCGRPVKEETECCQDCEKGRSFQEGRGIFVYDENMRQAILRYKYGGIRDYGEFFAGILWLYGGKEVLRWKPDLIVPVPMHKRKQKQRGFNQAEDLALRVGKLFEIPVAADLVVKKNATKSQKKLDAAERKRNLKHAFWADRPVNGLRILVIDDVFTTGSTIEALAECLLEQGAETVFFLTVAIGVKKELR